MGGNASSKLSFDLSNPNFEPNRNFIWRLLFDNLVNHIPPQYVVSVTKPSISWAKQKDPIIGGYEYRATEGFETEPIEIVCIDDEQNLVGNWIHYYLSLSGVDTGESSAYNVNTNVYRSKMRNIEIQMLNELGYPIESFILVDAWISGIRQSSLSYEDGGFSTYSMTITYNGYSYKVSKESKQVASEINYSNIKTTSSDGKLQTISRDKNALYHGDSRKKKNIKKGKSKKKQSKPFTTNN